MGVNKQELLSKLLTSKIQVEGDYREKEKAYKELGEKVQGAGSGMVKVKNKIHPGVKFTMGSAIKHIIEDEVYCTVQKEGADIRILPY